MPVGFGFVWGFFVIFVVVVCLLVFWGFFFGPVFLLQSFILKRNT